MIDTKEIKKIAKARLKDAEVLVASGTSGIATL
jgi:hypothetical protein